MNILITGGAGLVGSSFCEVLLSQNANVFCVDDLSLGSLKNLSSVSGKPGFDFLKSDVSIPEWYNAFKGKKIDLIIHLAACSDISLGNKNPDLDIQKTFQTTLHTLLATKALNIPNFIFSSTSAVYGANPIFPTPEETNKLYPISIYGAGKLSSEVLISAFVENYNLNAWIYRFGNVVGKKLTHGVIFDFRKKITDNQKFLQVLGNGKQEKTYIDVQDCLAGMLVGFNHKPENSTHSARYQVFNLSTSGSTQVSEIAKECVKVFGTEQTKIQYESSPVGWVGDVSKTSLNISKISNLGWKPKLNSTEAVFKSIREYHEWAKT